MGNTNVTVLVNSCDLYEDAWYPFFKLFNIQWSNCPYRFLLNTENKSFSCEGMNVEVFNEAVNCLDQNPDIGAICFDPDSRKELLGLIFKNPKEFVEIIITKLKHM